jgi:hypothetical protein
MNTADMTGGKSIAVWSQFISGVSTVIPFVAVNNIHGRKVPFFCSVLDTTQNNIMIYVQN